MTDGQVGHGRRALIGVLLVLLVAGLAIGPDADRDASAGHRGDSRFTTHGAGFPPQPAGSSDARDVPVTAFASATDADDTAVTTARRDPRVSAALTGRVELLGVEGMDAKSGRPGASRVSFYAYGSDRTVTAVVDDGVVVEVGQVPAEEWQPPLTPSEVDRAVDIARAAWLAAGRDEAQTLRGFTLLTARPDGGWFASRVAYVSFHAHIDARPQLVSWVDLSEGTVVRSRREAPGRSPAGPTHFDQQPVSTDVPRAGTVTWEGWSFGYEVSGRMDGISLVDVERQDVMVLARASLPSMTVFYEDDECGPFVDRLGGELTPVEWADDAEVVLREITIEGEPWLELGILDTLGEYVLYQVFYLSADGRLDAHMFAKGLQCNVDHVHYPFWRFDVDLAGAGGDQIVRRSAEGTTVEPTEFSADDAAGTSWQVRDVATGHRVDVTFDDGTWNVPGEVVPETSSEPNRVYGRRFETSESGTWLWPATDELPGDEGMPLTDTDVVLWYRGFLPHADAEGPDLWHSTGVRLDVSLSPGHFVRPR